MGTPKLIPGGDTNLVLNETTDNRGTKQPLGQFSRFPGATKKFAINDGALRDNEYRETMARMFIEMTSGERELFVNSLPDETKPLGRLLAGADTGGSGGTGFIDFLLQNVDESFSERYQVVESLADNFIVYMFGQNAPMFQYSGVLLNTYQDDQRVWMTRLYRDVLRGTQLARRRKLLRFRYDSVIVSGIVLNLSMQLQAGAEDRAPFSFSMIPMSYVIFTDAVGVPTQLKTPFTDGAKFGLPSTGTIDVSRLRVTTTTAAPGEATRERANQPSTEPFAVTKDQQAVLDAAAKITGRLDAATPAVTPPSNLRPGGPDILPPDPSNFLM
jgi:hypothetical protein